METMHWYDTSMSIHLTIEILDLTETVQDINWNYIEFIEDISNSNPLSSSNQHYEWENKRVGELNRIKGVPNDPSMFEFLP